MTNTKKFLNILPYFLTLVLLTIIFYGAKFVFAADDCSTAFPGYQCIDLSVVNEENFECYTGHCPGSNNIVCCKFINKEVSTQPVDSTPPSNNAPVKLTNPLTGSQSNLLIPILLGKIINSVMGVIGSLALAMFIYGGAVWMLSGGNQERVAKGKNILIWAAMGLVVIFTSYALVKFILTTITGT